MTQSTSSQSVLRRHHSEVPQTRTVWNIKLLLASIFLAVSIGVSGYFWHARQVVHMATLFLDRADELEREDKLDNAKEYVLRFIALRRGTSEANRAQIRLAKIVDKTSHTLQGKRQAISYLQQAVGVATEEERVELRRRLIELHIDVFRFNEGERVAAELLSATPDDPFANRALAICLHHQIRNGKLTGRRAIDITPGEQAEKALRLNPTDPRLHLILAVQYRRYFLNLSEKQRNAAKTEEERKKIADELIEEMVKAAPDDVLVWLNRSLYRDFFKLPGAGEDLAIALEKDPDNLEVRLATAQHYLKQPKFEDRAPAVEHLRYVLDNIDDKNESAWTNLAQYYLMGKQFDDAVNTLRDALKQIGADDLPLNSQLVIALTSADRLDEAEVQLNRTNEILSKMAVGKNPALRRKQQLEFDMLRATWALRAGEKRGDNALTRQAIEKLDTFSHGDSSGSIDVWVALARGYESQGEWDAAATAFEHAMQLDSTRIELRVASAVMWLAAGQLDRAERRLEELLALPQFAQDSSLWSNLAMARFQQQARRPPAQRDWSSYDAAINRAVAMAEERPGPEDWRIACIQVDRALLLPSANGDTDEAKLRRKELHDTLSKLEPKFPDARYLYERLIDLYSRLNFPASADRALSRLRELAGERGTTAVLASQLHAIRGENDQAEAELRSALEKLPAAERPTVRRALARGLLFQGKLDETRKLLRQFAEAKSFDVELLLLQGELALNAGDYKEVEAAEKQLKAMEGERGAYWHFLAARRLLDLDQAKDESQLQKAEEHLQTVIAVRPHWPAAFVAKGLLAERRKKIPEAIEAYKTAIDQGDRRVAVFQHLVLLLRDNPVEAERYMSMLTNPAAASQQLAGAEIALTYQKGQIARAVALARAEVERRPKSADAYAWLGQVLLSSYDAKQPDAERIANEAREAFSKVLELEPTKLAAWNGLFVFLVRTGHTDAARKMLDDIAGLKDLNASEKIELRIEALELLGDAREAEAAIMTALKADARNVKLLTRLARMQAATKPAEAIERLREAMKHDATYDPARRMLATLLVKQGGAKEWDEAQKLMQPATAAKTSKDDEVRWQVELLMQRGGTENIRNARQLLERLTAKPTAQPNDRLTLARIYETEDRHPSAIGQYQYLVARENPDPLHVVQYVAYLLRQRRWDEADNWLRQLEVKDSRSLPVLQARVSWLNGKGRADDIAPLLKKFADDYEAAADVSKEPVDNRRTRLYAIIGDICLETRQYAQAEIWHRKAYELTPSVYGGLIMALAQLDRKLEAIEICTRATELDKSPRPANLLCPLLLSGTVKLEELDRAESVISKVLDAHPNNTELLGNVASVRYFQRRTDDAQKLYQRALELDPRDVTALNNLATMLGERPDRCDEALSYIDRAIELAGPKSMLLDTKGTTLMQAGRVDEAVPLLEAAIRVPTPDPRFIFHLALALQRQGQTEKARELFQRARRGGLERQVLTDTDRRDLEELERALATEGKS